MIRYAITNRALFPGDDRQQQAKLLQQAARWASDGIELIQLREKDLPAAAVVSLAREMLRRLPPTTKLLINSRADIAVAVGAQGVHLTAQSGELMPAQIRQLYASAGLQRPIVTVSCHTIAEVSRARDDGADAVLYSPVFGKSIAGDMVFRAQGIERLRAACAAAAPIDLYALGGVTMQNAPACLEAGASGVAGIRLFHDVFHDAQD